MELISRAKINLFLHVTGKREDGYHTLISLMCPLALHDIVRLDFASPVLTVRCAHPAVPENEHNLAHEAARIFQREMARKGQDTPVRLAIEIEKTIPVAAGLGGGSSNAAAVLKGMNAHFNHPFSHRELMEMSLGIGADVPFFILEKPALATGIGERLKRYKGLDSLPVVLVNPGFPVSTRRIYKNLNLGLTNCGQKLNNFSFGEKKGEKKIEISRILCNDLEQVVSAKYPEIKHIKNRLLAAGARAALMTGSGPTVFGIFKSEERALNALDNLERERGWQTFLTRLET